MSGNVADSPGVSGHRLETAAKQILSLTSARSRCLLRDRLLLPVPCVLPHPTSISFSSGSSAKINEKSCYATAGVQYSSTALL